MEGTVPDLESINELLKDELLQVTSYLDSGGSGDLFMGRQDNLDREVAIKIIPVCGVAPVGNTILQEGRIVARLSHPNIVGVYDARLVGEPGDWYCCLVMEYIDGTNLANTVLSSTGEVIEVMIQICGAMEYAHAEGVIHCDLRPGNVLVDRDRRPKVTDFGISRFADQGEGGPLITGGDYLAPEQLQPGTDPGDPRRDVYSLGVMLKGLIRSLDPEKNGSGPGSSRQRKLQAIANRAADGDLEGRTRSVATLKKELCALLPVGRGSYLKKILIAASMIVVIGGLFLFLRESGRGEETSGKKESVFASESHPQPYPVILDVFPTEIPDTDKGFWLEIRGRNFQSTQNYYCYAGELILANVTSSDNAPATFVNDRLLKVWVERVAPKSRGNGEVAVRWGKKVGKEATGKFSHAYVITKEERD